MACNLNLQSAARYIHWAPPGDLDGLFQAVKAKCEALGLTKLGRGDAVTPANIPGDPTVNARGILAFINSVEAIGPEDEITDEDKVTSADEFSASDSLDVVNEKHSRKQAKLDRQKAKKASKAAKEAAQANLKKLYGTLQARLRSAGYTPPEAEKAPEPPPVPEGTPDPKPLA